MNFINYYYINDKKINSIINLFLKLIPTSKFYNQFTDFLKRVTFSDYKKNYEDDFFIFQTLFNARVRKFQILLFEGGSDVSLDHLGWSYFEYLNQTSLFLTRSLWKNYYHLSNNNKYNFFIKTFTMLISSQTIDTSFTFASNPIFDTILTRKSIISILNILNIDFVSKKDFLFSNNLDFNLLQNSFFLNYKSDFYNFFVTSGLDIYSLIKNFNFIFLNKTNSINFWDDKKYWFFCFLRSF